MYETLFREAIEFTLIVFTMIFGLIIWHVIALGRELKLSTALRAIGGMLTACAFLDILATVIIIHMLSWFETLDLTLAILMTGMIVMLPMLIMAWIGVIALAHYSIDFSKESDEIIRLVMKKENMNKSEAINHLIKIGYTHYYKTLGEK
jgi:uncharacterized membrane protein